MSTLNVGQTQAADTFFSMLFDDSIREMAISGPAGCGKTFLMGYLINDIMPRYREICKLMDMPPKYHDVMMTATTNKAAEVLGIATSRPTSTVHSFFNLVIKENYQTGKINLQKGAQWRVHENLIIFVDEAYFMDSHLRNYLLEGTRNCKLIYVGDKDQMSPVQEICCPIANPVNKIPTVHLTEPMRNAGKPELVSLCAQLKEEVNTLEFGDIFLHPGSIELLSDEEAEWMIRKTFDHQNTSSRILCFHNKRVNQFNDYIRELRGLPVQYEEGEYLINNSSIRSGAKGFSVEELVYIESLDDPETIYIEADREYPVDAVRATLTSKLTPDGADFYIPLDRNYLNQLQKYFSRNKMWRHFFFIKNTFPDLRPRDASTVYKAQGSTLESVFIDLSDISSVGVLDTIARLKYVAASRATTTVYLFGELNPKFGRIIT